MNLSSRPQVLADVIDATTFASVCRAVRRAVCDRLLADDAIAKAIQFGERLVQADIERRRGRLLLRHSAGDITAQADIEALELLLPAIRQPAFRLDAMGCFIVAQTPPRQTADA